jgi:maltose alpha-D-glucosyltransferase/alpha-amylase
VLADALFDEAFCRALVAAVGEGLEIATSEGKVRFVATGSFRDIAGPAPDRLDVGRPKAQTSNTVVTLGERLFVKGYRRLRAGINPELEVGRFLSEVAHFRHCVPVAGAVEHVAADGTPTTLALLQAYVANAGDGWSWAVDYLERFLEGRRMRDDPTPAGAHGGFVALIETLGTRTAELHRAFAIRSGDPAFDPEPFESADLDAWKGRLHDELAATIAAVVSHLDDMSASARIEAQALRDAGPRLHAWIDGVTLPQRGTLKARLHGDYHLAQLLIVNNDFLIIDFEGEPGRTLDERRAKQWPLRDVAGMLRSIDYARWTALERAAQGPEELRRLEPVAADWNDATRRAFLEAYARRAQGSGLFDDIADVGSLLALAELEKSLYELRYELGNRPSWVGIALAGVVARAREV